MNARAVREILLRQPKLVAQLLKIASDSDPDVHSGSKADCACPPHRLIVIFGLIGRSQALGLATLQDVEFDGRKALASVLEASSYRTPLQAVAALTLFSCPNVVEQIGLRPLFRTVRNGSRRGEPFLHPDGTLCAYDDNKSPTDAFLWANGLRRATDVQFNHLYSQSQCPDCYTSLSNICMTPSFLAKLTDTDKQTVANLKYRGWQLFGWSPAGQQAPAKPNGFDDLFWAPPHKSSNGSVEARMRGIMATRPKDRTVRITASIGWAFSNFEPDPTFCSPSITRLE